jgi:hypothetical protein
MRFGISGGCGGGGTAYIRIVADEIAVVLGELHSTATLDILNVRQFDVSIVISVAGILAFASDAEPCAHDLHIARCCERSRLSTTYDFNDNTFMKFMEMTVLTLLLHTFCRRALSIVLPKHCTTTMEPT